MWVQILDEKLPFVKFLINKVNQVNSLNEKDG